LEEESGVPHRSPLARARLAANYKFGSEIDKIGQASPVPSIAAHVIGPWERLVVVTGDRGAPWRREDVALTLAVARRAYNGSRVPVVVLAQDPEGLGDGIRGMGEVRVTTVRRGSGAVLDETRPSDLILIAAHVARKAGAVSQWRLSRARQGVSVAVVAGPNRLSVSPAVARRGVHGMVGSAR